MNERDEFEFKKQLVLAALTGLSQKFSGSNQKDVAQGVMMLANATLEAWKSNQPKKADWLE